MAASAKIKKRKFDQVKFRAAAIAFYSAGRRYLGPGEYQKDTEKYTQAYCHLSGWADAKTVKAAHIVPKSLESPELSYIFGVGDAVLSDPRNALTLYRTIEEALDAGLIALVPLEPKDGEETRWKCVLTDKSQTKQEVKDGFLWKDLDGKELQFLGKHRPAKRYLYFRFVMTYLNCQKEGSKMDWVEDVEAKGMMWPSPGPYLRQSMLIPLARKISDIYLPEAFYGNTTFETAEGSTSQPPDEEKTQVLSLTARIRATQRAVSEKVSDETDSEDDEDD